VPINGTYQIIAFGAQGGTEPPFGPGGLGAEIGVSFTLTQGEVLQIAVGGSGSDLSGGGGSFVVGPNNTPLIIAGGGGGGGGEECEPGPICPIDGDGGLTGPNGSGPIQNGIPSGGIDGNGGAGSNCSAFSGAGGGGFRTNGGNAVNLSGVGAEGGAAFPTLTGGGGSFGGGTGGFGGGGGAGAAAGGGGGYSGGGGACRAPGGAGAGGGGGSFGGGTDQILVAGIWPSNGEVVINLVSPVFAGTVGKPNCHGQSVSALARQFGGLNGAAEALGYPSVQALQDGISAFCDGSNQVTLR